MIPALLPKILSVPMCLAPRIFDDNALDDPLLLVDFAEKSCAPDK